MSDTTAALKKLLQPDTGMRRIPLTTESYRHQSAPLSSKLLLNMAAEQEPADARVVAALLPTTGLSLAFNVGTGPINCVNDHPSKIYLISGTHLWVATISGGVWSTTDLGDVGTPSGTNAVLLFYSIAVGVGAVVVCSPPKVFVSVADAPVTELAGPAEVTPVLPYTASSVTYLDGYWVYTSQSDPTIFFVSRLLDPLAIDALDFASLEAFPNAIYKVLSVGRDLWFAGATGWEIWYDAGNQDFPFRRKPDGIIQRPVGAPKACCKGDERVWWLSSDNRVYRSVGYQEERVSTHAVEYQVRLQGGLDISSSYIYHLLGHTYYVLNMTGQTLVYDAATKVWHNAASSTDGTGPWRPSCATQNLEGPFFGDRAAGRVLAGGGASDMGLDVKRQVVLPPLYAGTKRAFCTRLEIEMEVGAGAPGPVTLEWSDDGGINYTASRTLTSLPTTDTRKRVYTTRLGSFRNRVFRLTAFKPLTVYAIDADITAGNH